MQAKIIKIVSKDYGIYLTDEHQKVNASLAGKIRLHCSLPLVGDMVEVSKQADRYVIEKILPRKNFLLRPSIANVDQALIVMSVVEPNFSVSLIDRLSILIRAAGIKPILIVTKVDLAYSEDVEKMIQEYEQGQMPVIRCQKDIVNQQLMKVLADKISVLTGQSGAGKSTLLNTIDAHFKLATQAISKALGRGKHTTRHTELHEIGQGLVADTPGFSSLSFKHLLKKDVANYIDDFKPYLNHCYFNDCLHDNEPDCGIKKAVSDGLISKRRYQSYLQILTLINEEKRRIKR